MNKPTRIRIYRGEDDYSEYFIQRKKSLTLFNRCVEYDDYYEIAMYSWYMRICKVTLEITSDLHDANDFEKMNDRWAVVY